MSDKATYRTFLTRTTSGADSSPEAGDKAPRRIHHAQVIRADLTLVPDPAADPGEGVPAPPAAACAGDEPDLGESHRNSKPFRLWRRRSRPGRGRAEGQGRAIRCSSPAPASPCSTRICAATRPPPGRCAPAPRAAERRRLRQDPAPQRATKARCATCASPSATTPVPQRNCSGCGATSPAGRPASTQAGSSTRRRGSIWLVDPNGLAASLKACAGEGDPVSAAAKAAALAFSAFPDAPARRCRDFCALAVRPRPRHPAALAAARAADRDENSGS